MAREQENHGGCATVTAAAGQYGPEYNDVRNINSLGCCWQKIQQDVSKFHGFYERLERHPRSGTTPDDMIFQHMSFLLSIPLLVIVWFSEDESLLDDELLESDS
ncbi:Uncharacterized protein Fot_02299 [Forsythia ovata]|uniref:Uncharacterized protein n=1 Tax=Forsythia ovata TaxID=205694 RepID=A0ABD1X7C0_9LAMI